MDKKNSPAKPKTNAVKPQFSYVDADKLDRDLECVVCLEPLFEPVDFQCGKMACKICADEVETCPTCGKECKVHSFIKSKFVLNPLNDLKVSCPSCDQIFRRQDFLPHKPNCLIDCPQGCNEKIEPNSTTKHFETCSKTQVECEGKEILCPWKGNRESLVRHLEECAFIKIRQPLESVINELNTLRLQMRNPLLLEMIEEKRKQKEEARKAAEEAAERKAKEEVERKAKEEAERKAKEEAAEEAKEKAERKAKAEEDFKKLNIPIAQYSQKLVEFAQKGDLEVCKLLVKKGAEINARNNRGWTPLHQAASGGHLEVCKLLANAGADLEAKSNSGWTPLHLAASEGHLEICKFLLTKRAVRDDYFAQFAARNRWNI